MKRPRIYACHDCRRLVLRAGATARNLPRCRSCLADFLRRYARIRSGS